jgi:DNA processing protein
VCELGVVLSENPPGRRPEPWRFPSRNRLIAGLTALVVVVESHAKGGSLITADAAIERGIEVRVVPGPVHSPASAGTNQLLYDGPGPVRGAQDVLDAIGLLRSTCAGPAGDDPPARSVLQPSRTAVSVVPRDLEVVLDAVPWVPQPLGSIAIACGRPVTEVLASLMRLEDLGVVESQGGWWGRKASSGRARGGRRPRAR